MRFCFGCILVQLVLQFWIRGISVGERVCLVKSCVLQPSWLQVSTFGAPRCLPNLPPLSLEIADVSPCTFPRRTPYHHIGVGKPVEICFLFIAVSISLRFRGKGDFRLFPTRPLSQSRARVCVCEMPTLLSFSMLLQHPQSRSQQQRSSDICTVGIPDSLSQVLGPIRGSCFLGVCFAQPAAF